MLLTIQNPRRLLRRKSSRELSQHHHKSLLIFPHKFRPQLCFTFGKFFTRSSKPLLFASTNPSHRP